MLAPDAIEKESHHGNIDHEHENFCRSWMPVYSVNFHREQRARDDYAEPNGPTLHQPKSDSLGQEESRVNKAADCEILNPIRSEGSRLQNDPTNITAARIETEPCNPLFQEARYVGVNQPESAHSNSDQPEQFSIRAFHATASS